MDQRIFGGPFTVGESYSGVFSIQGKLDSGGFRATRLHDGMKTCIYGADLPLKVVSICNAKVETVQPIPQLRALAHTWWEASSSSTSSLSPWLLELCAGFGGMGIGASFLGGLPGISVDWNSASAEHLRRNGHGQVLQLDITHADTADHSSRTTTTTAPMHWRCFSPTFPKTRPTSPARSASSASPPSTPAPTNPS